MRRRLWDWGTVALVVLVVVLTLGIGVLLAARRMWVEFSAYVVFVAWQAAEARGKTNELALQLRVPDDDLILARHGLNMADPERNIDVNSPLFTDLLTGLTGAGDKAATETADSLVRRQAVRIFMERTDHLAEARSEAERWVGATPRSAKRLANRLMFTVAVAATGGLLTTDSGVRGAHLGKWVALAEGWPRLAARIHADPPTLRRLEAAARDEKAFAAAIREHLPNPVDVDRLRQLLAADDPTLGDIAWSLTRLAPAPAGQPTRSTAYSVR